MPGTFTFSWVTVRSISTISPSRRFLQIPFSGLPAPGGRKKRRTTSEDAADGMPHSLRGILQPVRGADGPSAEEAPFGPRRRKGLPARGRFPRRRYHRASRPGNEIVDGDNPDRYGGAHEEKTRV